MDYFEKNIKLFQNSYVEKIREKRKTLLEDKEMIVSKDQCEESIFGINRAEHLWYLNSKYDAKKAAREYAKRYEKESDYKIFFVFGLSDGKAIQELLKICNNTNRVVIYEPNEIIFLKLMETAAFEEILKDEKVAIIVSNLIGDMESVLTGEISYFRRKLMEVCILPNYDVLYPDECEKYMDTIVKVSENVVMYKNTHLYFNKMIATNMIGNVYDMLFQSDIYQLKQQFNKIDFTRIPAIIVSAGPSLDKNIKELKQAEGKAFIIVVDAALRSVARAGIHFNFGISVDGETPSRFFEDPNIEYVPHAVELHSNALTMKDIKGTHFYFNASFGWCSMIIGNTLDYTVPGLPVGGSVSTDAFELVRYLGFKTIILIGQDLAFTDGKGHTETFHDKCGENEEFAQQHTRRWVEDAAGNPLPTDIQMEWYLRWFEKEFEKYEKELRIIDATEGGAKIKGTIIQTLKETIAQECKEEIDFDELIKKAPKTYSEANRKTISKNIFAWADKIEHLRQTFLDGIQEYQNIKESYENHTVGSEELKEMAEKLKKWNRIDQEENTMEILMYYNAKVEYEVQDTIWEQKDSDIGDITAKGIQLFEGYVRALDEFEIDMERLLLSKIREI
ncbi:MAG: 6-hydroxymethylpterin diphosphokinase MptE-like protein [Lachnospiraceae bacterium]